MSTKNLINQLELAYAPLTAYEYAVVKDDQGTEKAIENASLYIIAQRPVITFENVIPDKRVFQLNFEIHQQGNPTVLKGKLPFTQSIFGLTEDDDKIGIGFNNLDKSIKQDIPPFNNIHGFSLIKLHDTGNEFLFWFSPEKLLQNWWAGYITCEIEGDFRSFTQYNVHYVGKATKQNILKRLKGHSTFQDILSMETPLTPKQIPANEIVILPFKFRDNMHIESFGDEDTPKYMAATFMGKNQPKQETIFLDAEKAIIKAIKPTYNKEMFNNYPKSVDGLYAHNYNQILYTFSDPITLKYKEGEIVGGLSFFGGDTIIVKNNAELILDKHEV